MRRLFAFWHAQGIGSGLARMRALPFMSRLRIETDNEHSPSGLPQGATPTDVAMMRRAIELANKAAAMGEVPIGALVHRDGQIIAEAHNLVETANDPTAHAEVRVIRAASEFLGERRLNECTLVVTLEPCSMCAGAIVLGRIGRLVFGATDPKAGGIDSVFKICSNDELNHRPEISRGVLSEECGRLLTEFFKSRRAANKALRKSGQPRKKAKNLLARNRRRVG